jgi:prevent-host-death family protein
MHMAALDASDDPDGPLDRPDRLRVREVPVTELRRRAAEVIARVVEGEAAVISRHGWPVGVLLPLENALNALAQEVAPGELKELEELFAQRADRRRWSQLLHGRWWNGGGIHGPYR